MLIAKDIMTSPVVAVGPDSTVGEVADLLVSHGISAVPVIDRGALLGIVSEGDLTAGPRSGRPAASILPGGFGFSPTMPLSPRTMSGLIPST